MGVFDWVSTSPLLAPAVKGCPRSRDSRAPSGHCCSTAISSDARNRSTCGPKFYPPPPQERRSDMQNAWGRERERERQGTDAEAEEEETRNEEKTMFGSG